MMLLTKELEARFAQLGKQDKPDAIVVAKFFTPDSNWTWWATEYNPEDRCFFGLVQGFEVELGYFSLDEMLEVRGSLGLPIERDKYRDEKPLNEVKEKAEKAHYAS